MIACIEYQNKNYTVDFTQPIDISIPIAHHQGVKAWHVPHPKITPVVSGDFTGEIKQGASVNFRNIFFNPHGNGTHTECAAHIMDIPYTILDFLPKTIQIAQLISIKPQNINNDQVLFPEGVKIFPEVEALIVRTLPNDEEKKTKNYSDTNPPYFDVEFMQMTLQHNIKHFLTDLPSVDKENDNGLLLCHKTFFETHKPLAELPRKTITELIYIPDNVEDGVYLLDLQVAPFINDAAPSRPLIYKIKK